MKQFLWCIAFLFTSAFWAFGQSNNVIPYQKNITLAVGQAAVIHGMRGECGQSPDVSKFDKAGPTKRGVLSLGQPGVRKSTSCGGFTPAIEIVFTATKPGRETLKLFGDKIKIRVIR